MSPLLVWLYSLIAAAVSGAGNSVSCTVSASITDPEHFNIHRGFIKLATIAVSSATVGAVIGAGLYLRSSPLPQLGDGDRRNPQAVTYGGPERRKARKRE